jgi:hypothetical protein
MRVVDLPNGAVDYSVMTESVAQIDPQYFEDINDADNLEFRLRAIVEAGSAAVYVPEHGWNTGVLPSVQGWHDDWSATLSQDSALALRSRTPIIHGAAHGLYISPYSTGREVTTEENVRFQMGNVNKVIDAGLWLLAES